MTSQLLFIVMSFDTTDEKLQPVEHDSYVTVVKARIMPVDKGALLCKHTYFLVDESSGPP